MSATMNQFLLALVNADDRRRDAALRVLQGEFAVKAILGEQSPAASSPTGPLLLAMGDAAKLLGVSRCTFWRMVRERTFTPVEILPGTFRISRAEIEHFSSAPLRPKRKPATQHKES